MITRTELFALSVNERLFYLEKAASLMRLPSHLIEKDLWVTFLLQQLFALPDLGNALTFKGGTSLSKIHGLIQRFSEDIDLSIEKGFLGFHGERLPENAVSRKQRERLLNELQSVCKSYVREQIMNGLTHAISRTLPDSSDWSLEVDESDPDGQSLAFTYPSSTASVSQYVNPVIKVEFGARGEHWPTEDAQTTSYLHSSLPDAVEPWKFTVRVLSPVRTFWEKATILHLYSNYPEGKKLPLRQSRHFYDLYCLLQSPVKQQACNQLELLRSVCEHKALYFSSAAAKYTEAYSGGLKLVPSLQLLTEAQRDYREMAPMFYETVVPWEKIVEELRNFEAEMQLLSPAAVS